VTGPAAGGTAATGRRRAGIAAVVASALCFGAMAIMARVAYASGVDTTTLLALRFSIAAVVMFALAGSTGVTWPRGRTLAVLVAMGAVGYAGQAFSFFTALTLAPAGLVALLLYLHPALVAVLSALLRHETLSRRKLVALAVALAGMTLTVLPTLADAARAAHPGIVRGIAFGVAAAAIYAGYIVVGARVGRRTAPLPMAAIVIGSAAVLFAAVAAAAGPRWPATAAGWLAVLGIALISTVAAITLFFAGLERIGPTQASTLSTIEPLFTVLLAAVLLGETITPLQMAGGALILAAVLLLARAPLRR
jgi:drug/metabolite transporter (DMT)-like permease